VTQTRDPYRLQDVALRWSTDDSYLEWLDADEWGVDESDWDRLTKGMATQARNRLRRYLAMNGSAVWKRVDAAIKDARATVDQHPGGSLVASVTAAELIVRYLLFRPMYASLVFNTKLAMKLVREGPRSPARADRKLLPDVCRVWGFELESAVLPNGTHLWDTLETLVELRHLYVHRAEPVKREHAQGGMDCVDGLLTQVVKPLVSQVGLTWPPIEWTHNGRTHDPIDSTYEYMGS
jgi:hypothetical protein